MNEKRILEFAREHGYESAEYRREWKEYSCYEPVFSLEQPISYIGLPLMILVKGDTIRMTTPEEALEMLE